MVTDRAHITTWSRVIISIIRVKNNKKYDGCIWRYLSSVTVCAAASWDSCAGSLKHARSAPQQQQLQQHYNSTHSVISW